MRIAHHFNEIPLLQGPQGITIGSFDGVHRGHRHLICTLRERVGADGTVAVFTFSNHPSEVFTPRVPLICSLEHKLRLLKELGVNLVVLQSFTPSFAETSYDQFLYSLHSSFPFQFLILGHGEKFGRKKEGDEEHVKQMGKKLLFKASYLPKIELESGMISSGKIRSLIHEGLLADASTLLGRPYSLLLRMERGEYFDLQGFCVPPLGDYSVEVRSDHFSFVTTAHLACHLTLDDLDSKEIEVGSWVEIVFINR